MFRHRPFRAGCLWFITTVFLCMQLMTTAYACPALERAPAAEAMPGCESMASNTMDPEQPTLCKAHCDKNKQSSTADAQTTSLPTPALLAHGLGWRVADEDHAAAISRPTRNAGPPRGTLPLFITYLVLRN
jgi:hypothetical protein